MEALIHTSSSTKIYTEGYHVPRRVLGASRAPTGEFWSICSPNGTQQPYKGQDPPRPGFSPLQARNSASRPTFLTDFSAHPGLDLHSWFGRSDR